MTIRPSIDVATRVSAQLSEVLEKFTEDPDRENPATLAEVRAALRRRGEPPAGETEYLHPQENRESLLVELDALIEEYGEDMLADNFVTGRASEGLSRVIETVASDRNRPRQPTLGGVRDAMTGGLIAKMIGDGALDEDDNSALLAEIEELIRRHGTSALAEPFVRYE
jgi:hypothetical protein